MTLSSAPTCILLAAACWTAAAAAEQTQPTAEGALRSNEAMLMLSYQVINVPGDKPIDLAGFHVHSKVSDGLYLGVGVYGPHLKGDYGGFMAFDLGAHLQRRLSGPLSLTADLSGGGGGGGRSPTHAALLSGTGGFVKASVGLAYDLGPVTLGASVTHMKFRNSLISGTHPSVFLTVPYTYLAGPYSRHGKPLSSAEESRAAAEIGESMLTFSLDNFKQINPQGSSKGTVRNADLQYSHFLSPEVYWFAALGVGYSGLPSYNQMLGGLGRRIRLSPHLNLYGQLGVGTGGYAPEQIDTGPGLLVYPKLSVEWELTPSLGLALSAGYLAAPRGSSRNQTYALSLTQHLGSGPIPADDQVQARWYGLRVNFLQQTEFNVRYRDMKTSELPLIGLQIDAPLNDYWYLPLQGSVAYKDYLGFPGYGEILAGLGLQTRTGQTGNLQLFGQFMVGANVHGPGYKASGGLRYLLSDRLALQLSAGHIETRKSANRRFSADTLGIGLDYRFSVLRR